MKARVNHGGGGVDRHGRRRTDGRSPYPRARGRLPLVALNASPGGNHSAVVEHYARLAPSYDGRWDRYTRRTLSLLVDRIELGVTRPESILDVACGTGRLTEMIHAARTVPRPHVTGVDLSPQMIEIARQRMPQAPGSGVEWKVAPAEELPVGDAQFDAVTCANAFHLVSDPARALAEFRRVLKPGGRLLILDWCREYPQMAGVLVLSRLFGKQYRRIETVDGLSRRLEAAGFEVVRVDKLKATWFWGTMCIVAERATDAAISQS